jgi:hypothetical protein
MEIQLCCIAIIRARTRLRGRSNICCQRYDCNAIAKNLVRQPVAAVASKAGVTTQFPISTACCSAGHCEWAVRHSSLPKVAPEGFVFQG